MTTIESLEHQSSDAGIFQVLQAAIDSYGFERFIFSGLPDPGVDVRPFVLFSGWSEEWFAHYTKEGFVHADPVPRRALTTSMPFDWSEAYAAFDWDPAARQVVDTARDFGMMDGFCIPVHMGGGIRGVVSLAGDAQQLTGRRRVELQMLALHAHSQLRRLNADNDAPAPRRSITEREAEILKWVALGKTASEIAGITGLTARTVNQHCENAQRKLGTSNRVHTVVEALRQHLISL